MIDASRLGHSLATALKDRPHGIPVQPNRSLPLRPPPPPPARISVSKSPKSSSLTPSPTSPAAQNGKDSRKRLSVDGDCTREESLTIDNNVSGIGVVGMNFYDSQDKDEEDSCRIPDQTRHSKSLDHEESDDTSLGDSNRRKSFDSETISQHKKRNSFNSDLASPDATYPMEKKRRGSYAKKRKLSSDDNSDGFRIETSSKLQKIAPKLKSTNHERVESSGIGLPTIIRSRNAKAPRIEAEVRRTSFAPIRPKPPPGIPECPVAIPIELAQAINLTDSSRSKKNNAEANRTIAPSKPKIPKIRIIQNGRRFSKHVEDVENTLPSMPSLDLDSQNENNNGKNGANAARQPVTNCEAKLSKDSPSKTNYKIVQKDVDSIQDKMNKSYSDVSVTNQTMVQIHVLSYSKDLIIMSAPQIITNGNMVGTIEATVPHKLSSIIENGGDTTKLNDVSIDKKQHEDLSGREQLQYMLQNKDTTTGSAETPGISQIDKCKGDKLMVDKPEEIRTESHQDRSKIDLEKKELRKQRLAVRLHKFNEEKKYLELKVKQTTDPSRLTRLQQKINCATKKIENTKKYLDKLISFQTPTISADPPQSRIQVRQDLVDTTSTESVEPVRRSPFVPCSEADESPVAMSSRTSSPPVITISETDSASSDEEDSYVIDEMVSDNVKPAIKTQPDLKIELKHVPTMNVKRDSPPSPKDDYPAENTLYPTTPPDVKVQPVTSIVDSAPLIEQPVPLTQEPEITNNNAEYVDKSLQSNSDMVPAGGIEVIKRLPPLIRDPINYSSKDMSRTAEQKSPNVENRAQNLNSATGIFEKDPMTSVAEKKSPNATYGIQINLNSVPEEFDPVKQNCRCSICLRGSTSVSVQNQNPSQIQTSSKDVNSYIPTPVINQTVNQENINSHPATNYSGHQTDYRAQGNVSSMFSRDNGGANINLSSPLQGHSALPLPPYSQRNLTAQGYPVPGEHSPNYQATQWSNQLPGTKNTVPVTPDQDGATRPSILASHLLKSRAQEPSNISRQTKLPSLMTEQFPTLGNWAAQMTTDPTPRKPVNKTTSPQINAHPVIQHSNGPKAMGSDMYKMTASAVDARHPAAGSANGTHWQPTRTWTDQQRPPPAYPVPRSNPALYRNNYPANPQNTQNCYVATPGQHGPVYIRYPEHPYRQSLSTPQGARSMEYPPVPQNKQSPYYPPPTTIRQVVPVSYQNQGQVNTGHAVKSLAMMQNKYIQPTTYTPQDAFQHWLAAKSPNRQYLSPQYLSPQYHGYGTQAKPTDNSALYTAARPQNKNSTPVIVARETTQRREPRVQSAINATLPISRAGYNERIVQPNRVVMDGLNEPLDLGRTSTIPQSVKAQSIPSRSNNVKCSLCGTNDPKFNCIDCQAAFYCNQKCQAQHWKIHILECSQKMPRLKKVS